MLEEMNVKIIKNNFLEVKRKKRIINHKKYKKKSVPIYIIILTLAIFIILIIYKLKITYVYSRIKLILSKFEAKNQPPIMVDSKNQHLRIKFQNEIKFVQSCLDDNKILPFEKYSNPKLSLVIPYYNSVKYLTRLLRSIQKQELKEIEIIFIDDNSNDGGYELMEEYSKIDKRIVLLRNEENKGCLYGYVRSILEAKAEYTMVIDGDDMILSNLKKLYEISVENGKDINDFGHLTGLLTDFKQNKFKDRQLYQPDIGELIFRRQYGANTFIVKKIMKSEIIKKAVKTIKDEYLNSKIILHCDTLVFISIFYYVKTYQSHSNLFLYFKIRNEKSSSSGIQEKYNELFRVSVYLVKYISELPYDSEQTYNRHIDFAFKIVLAWPLYLCGHRKLIVDWKLVNEVMNSILNNKDLNKRNKNKIFNINNLIKIKNNYNYIKNF